jgi:hypothetical protein
MEPNDQNKIQNDIDSNRKMTGSFDNENVSYLVP